MNDFQLTYEGLLADDHRMDMRRFGYAIVGLDHLITTGVVALTEHRFAKARERVDFTIVAEPPREGSVEILGGLISAYQALQASFPFVAEMIRSKCPDLIWHWLSFSFKWLGGRKQEAEPHLDKLIDFMRSIHQDTLRDRQDERQFLLQVIEAERQNAARVVMPLGNSSEVLRIKGPGSDQPTKIDVPMAAAVRSKENLEVSDVKEVQLRIDGITKHSNRASVEFLDDPEKFYHAEIRDPMIGVNDNLYFRALASGQPIRVLIRNSFKGDEIHRVYILGTANPDGGMYGARITRA